MKLKAELPEVSNPDAASVSVPGQQSRVSALAPYVGRESSELIPREKASFTTEEAYRTLGVASASPWEAIEQARRTLVDRAHPGRTAGLSEEQRELAQAQAPSGGKDKAPTIVVGSSEAPSEPSTFLSSTTARGTLRCLSSALNCRSVLWSPSASENIFSRSTMPF